MTLLIAAGWLALAVLAAALAALAYFVVRTRRIAAWAERSVPASGSFVDIGVDRIHYMEAGQGRPILFVHGLGGQLHHFRHTLFDRLAGDFRVVALDRPGSGYSVRANSEEGSIGEQAAVLAKFVEALRLERPLVVGHSLGGAIALAYAIDHPDRLAGLVLISPLTHTPDAVPPEFRALDVRPRWLRRLTAETIAVPRSLKFAPQTLDFVFGPQAMPQDYPIGGGGMAGLRPSHIFATMSDFVAIARSLPAYETRYGALPVPAVLMFGTADRVLDHRLNGVATADRLPGIELELLEGMGHMLQFVATDRVEAAIRRVAAKGAPGGARDG